MKALVFILACAILTASIGCSDEPTRTGNAKTIFDSADEYTDKSRSNFESCIAEYQPKPEKMERLENGAVDITFRLKDETKIKVIFVDNPPNQKVYMIQ